MGVFLSADSKQGNAQGMNPYAYVGGNPETMNDPTGQYFANPGGPGSTGNGNPNPPAPTCETLGTCPAGIGYRGGGCEQNFDCIVPRDWNKLQLGVKGVRIGLVAVKIYISTAAGDIGTARAYLLDFLNSILGLPYDSNVAATFLYGSRESSSFWKTLVKMFGEGGAERFANGVGFVADLLGGALYFADDIITFQTDPGNVWRQSEDILGTLSSAINLLGDEVAAAMGWDAETLGIIGDIMGAMAMAMQAYDLVSSILNSLGQGQNNDNQRQGSKGGGGPPFPPFSATQFMPPWWSLMEPNPA